MNQKKTNLACMVAQTYSKFEKPEMVTIFFHLSSVRNSLSLQLIMIWLFFSLTVFSEVDVHYDDACHNFIDQLSYVGLSSGLCHIATMQILGAYFDKHKHVAFASTGVACDLAAVS